jgi:WD40 repeat protein
MTAKIWDAESGKLILNVPGHHDALNAVAFSPDGRWLATGSSDRWAVVWDLATGGIVSKMNHEGDVAGLAFSPGGQRLATCSLDRTARVWNGVTGALELTLLGHVNAVTSVVFDAEGKRLATSSWDRTARIWDARDGRPLLKITHPGEVHTVAFSRDGRMLATGGEMKIPCVYPLDLAELRKVAAACTTRELTPEERREYLHES